MGGKIIICALALALCGCVDTQELPLAPNVMRLNTSAGGILFTGQAVPQTMRLAAQRTLEAGYTHFRLEQASSSQGSELVGVQTYGQATNFGNGFIVGNTAATPVYAPTANVGVTVIMLRKGDAGFESAFDAKETLRKYAS